MLQHVARPPMHCTTALVRVPRHWSMVMAFRPCIPSSRRPLLAQPPADPLPMISLQTTPYTVSSCHRSAKAVQGRTALNPNTGLEQMTQPDDHKIPSCIACCYTTTSIPCTTMPYASFNTSDPVDLHDTALSGPIHPRHPLRLHAPNGVLASSCMLGHTGCSDTQVAVL